VAKNDSGFGVIFDTLTVPLYAALSDPKDKIISTLEQLAQEIQSAAQDNAGWADRTGAARDGLTAQVTEEASEVTLSLFHTVDYGQWLETIQSGRFAVIMPTLEQYADRVFDAVSAERRSG
jgi:hypothetical protein